MWLDCPFLQRQVELTAEREAHITAEHSEMLPNIAGRIAQALLLPGAIMRSRRSTTALMFSRWYDDFLNGKYLIVVVERDRSGRCWVITAHPSDIELRRADMVGKLTFRYDAIGDILHVETRPPYAAQGSRQLEDEIVVRFNPETREVENMEILFFSKRLRSGETLDLPITGDLGIAV